MPGMTDYRWSNGATTATIVLKEPIFAISVTANDSNGCRRGSGTVQILFNVRPEPVVEYSHPSLTTTRQYASYQWLNFGEPIPGATERTHTIVTAGDYSVEVESTDGCKGISSIVEVIITGVEQPGEPSSTLSIFPQPSRDRAVVAFDLATAGKLEITLRDIRGTTVARFEDEATAGRYRREISTAGLPPGAYIVTVTTGGKSAQVKMVKK